jgi:hypothetical protein
MNRKKKVLIGCGRKVMLSIPPSQMGRKKTMVSKLVKKLMLSTPTTSNGHKTFRTILEDPWAPTEGGEGGEGRTLWTLESEIHKVPKDPPIKMHTLTPAPSPNFSSTMTLRQPSQDNLINSGPYCEAM